MRIGSLCTGYGGLDHGVQTVYGGDVVWVSDIDEGARKILDHRYPGIPNLGDFTITDWSTVEPIDVLTAGYPCQPFSNAGQRKGTADERHIWPDVRDAIRCLRPRLTFLENVPGHRSLGFDRVLADLAEDGMHVRWTSVRASDVGAPHARERLFIAVTYSASVRLDGHHPPQPGRKLPTRSSGTDSPVQWGAHRPRITSWGRELGREAPRPWDYGKTGSARLSPLFAEWMMGLPAGYVTNVPGITRQEALHALGNGVVPQQAAAALTQMLTA